MNSLKSKKLHTKKELQDIISYDPLTGEFRDTGTGQIILPEKSGNIKIKELWYRARRIAWIMAYGEEAPFRLKMKDGDINNLKLSNIVKSGKFDGGKSYAEWLEKYLGTLTHQLEIARKAPRKKYCAQRKINTQILTQSKQGTVNADGFDELELAAARMLVRHALSRLGRTAKTEEGRGESGKKLNK